MDQKKFSQLPVDDNPTLTDYAAELDTETSLTKRVLLQKILDLFKASGSLPTLRTVTYYTADNTWTKPAGMTGNGYVDVELVGGGGGGGGADNDRAEGAGGGGGGYSRKTIQAASLGATEAVDVGAAGVGGAGTGAATAGATSSFGAHLQATGGALGASMSGGVAVTAAGGLGGVGSGGDFNIPGQPGLPGLVRASLTTEYGNGGASMFGAGGTAATAVSGDGNPGLGYGAGGSGAQANSATDRTGGAGTAGIIIVREYY